MVTLRKQKVLIYVDRSSKQWIVRDPDGNYWIVPAGQNLWNHRQPFELTEESDLEAVPGHYKYLLDLPF